MISIYLIRHGLAGDRTNDRDDHLRALTPEGHRKTHGVAKSLRKLGLDLDVIMSSPLIRAQETAQILADTNPSPVAVITTDCLAPDGDPQHNLQLWCAAVRQNVLPQWDLSADLAIAVVGHEPDLSAWAELLVWGAVKGGIVLKKAGVMGLTLPSTGEWVGNSILFLLVPPKVLLLS
jgi:phosphohistidine phosphatase